jgi:hypothetical protein
MNDLHEIEGACSRVEVMVRGGGRDKSRTSGGGRRYTKPHISIILEGNSRKIPGRTMT